MGLHALIAHVDNRYSVTQIRPKLKKWKVHLKTKEHL